MSAEPLILDTLNLAKLKRYGVCILSDARTLTQPEEEMIRRYVKEGGVLIACASSSRFDQWGRGRKDYGLSDVFGASFKATRKPGTGRIKATGDFAREGVAEGYTLPHGIPFVDEIGRITGEVIGILDDKPAIVRNRFGKGLSIFLAADTVGDDLWRDLIEAGLKEKGIRPAVEVEGCPGGVEVVPRTQPETGRLMIHFLNWTDKPIAGIEVHLNVRKEKIKHLFYGVDEQKIEPEVEEGRPSFNLRELDVYELIVLER